MIFRSFKTLEYTHLTNSGVSRDFKPVNDAIFCRDLSKIFRKIVSWLTDIEITTEMTNNSR